MRITVKFSQLAESADAERGVIVEWLHSPGDQIQKDESLVVIGVGKVDVEIPCPAKGTLVEILAEKGAEVAVGAPICVVET